MRIGELADAAGVSTRTVRHYHRIGLLPEPARESNGYRDYDLRDLLRLTRIRRLVELGLSLDECRDALTDDEGRDLREILTELDTDLARQERAIQHRRKRLAELLRRPDGVPLTADDAVTGELADLLTEIGSRFPDSSTARKDREYLALLEGSGAGGEVVSALRRALTDPARAELFASLYQRFDELASASTDDPRIDALARDTFEAMPPEIRAGVDGSDPDEHLFGTAVLADLAPAQAEVARRLMRQQGRES